MAVDDVLEQNPKPTYESSIGTDNETQDVDGCKDMLNHIYPSSISDVADSYNYDLEDFEIALLHGYAPNIGNSFDGSIRARRQALESIAKQAIESECDFVGDLRYVHDQYGVYATATGAYGVSDDEGADDDSDEVEDSEDNDSDES